MRKRKVLNDEDLIKSIQKVTSMINYRLSQKGDYGYIGPHETYGIIAEEFAELMDSLRENNSQNFYRELVDIAVACVIGMASQLPADTKADGKRP